MFSETFKVRFYETDGLRHVNNTVVPKWFETAREPIFKLFNPSLDLSRWPLIIASVAVDYLAQIHYGKDVEIKTGIARIGNSSFTVYQEVWQGDIRVAKGSTTMVHFDYETQKSKVISEEVRAQLTAWLCEAD